MNNQREIITETRESYYPDDIISIKNFDLDEVLEYEKPYQNNSIYCVAYKLAHGERSTHIHLDKYDRDIFLSLFHPDKKCGSYLIGSSIFLVKESIFQILIFITPQKLVLSQIMICLLKKY